MIAPGSLITARAICWIGALVLRPGARSTPFFADDICLVLAIRGTGCAAQAMILLPENRVGWCPLEWSLTVLA